MKKYVFSEDILRFGPGAPPCRLSESEAFEYCRRLTRSHYENFTVAGFLLPRELRRPFHAVYAYCRWSDDLADENDGTDAARRLAMERLAWWNDGLDECFDESDTTPETPAHPVYRALRGVARQFHLPKEPFADLLTAFRRDQVRRSYETLDELLDYCRFSADPVGRIVLHLVYPDDPARPDAEQLTWSDSICTGLQLANFWQDVARDAAMGRIYLPRDVADRHGVSTDRLADSPAFRAMLAELVADARARLLAGEPLIRSAPKRIRVDLSLFLRGGLAVLDAIEQNEYNVLLKRPVVGRRAKLRILLQCALRG